MSWDETRRIYRQKAWHAIAEGTPHVPVLARDLEYLLEQAELAEKLVGAPNAGPKPNKFAAQIAKDGGLTYQVDGEQARFIPVDERTRPRQEAPSTIGEILACEVCHASVDDALGAAMLYWQADDMCRVTAMMLGHKRCTLDERGRAPQGYSLELRWIADGRVALKKLSSITVDYRWTGAQLQRLTDIAFAVAWVATPKDAEWSRQVERDGGMV